MQEYEQIVVGVLCIATNKYKQFVELFVEGVKKYFLPNNDVIIFLFTDEYVSCKGNNRVKIQQHPIESYKFPEATMLRYAVFKKYEGFFSGMDYLYYSDIDMGFVSEVGGEILHDIVAVRHPGFFSKGGGSWETREESQCYVPPDKRLKYFAGGFSGGSSKVYLYAIDYMDKWIKTDLENGITPIWHDESAWNRFVTTVDGITELDPRYCMVENMELRKLWGIDHLEPKILALDKNHAEIRK